VNGRVVDPDVEVAAAVLAALMPGVIADARAEIRAEIGRARAELEPLQKGARERKAGPV
jgi:hypothetical protein